MAFRLQRNKIAVFLPSLLKSAPCAFGLTALFVLPGFAQEPQTSRAPAVPLAGLLTEAERHNPQIEAAREGWQSAKQTPAQVSALPDPQFQVQQVNVGSPRPFAGYTNSDFAYAGLGASQDIPFPGKLRLRGEVARRDADIAGNRADAVCRAVLAEVKATYFQLGYLSGTLAILQDDTQLLEQIEQAAEARYRSGLGNQQDVLQAQIQQTKLLRDISMHHLEAGETQARLKQLLNRSQSSADIEPVSPGETPLHASFDEILAEAQSRNPGIAAAQNTIERQKLQVDVAHKDFYPDFNAQFMYQQTDPEHFRSYYQFTFGVKIPLHYGKQRAELAQAEAELSRSRSEHEAQSQQVAAELRQQYLIAQQTEELLKINREGLIPQARAGFQAGLAAYRNNRQDFSGLLTSYLDLLHLEQDNWQNIASHETAIARLEEMTGLSLRADAVKE